jgi:hypothetical protein
MSVAGDTRYTAFISYCSTSRAVATRLKRDLYAIAKRHTGHPGLKIFLDTSYLQPGPLTAEIRTAVESSRFLIVVLDGETHRSSWVADEINYWIAAGGTPERLFLVRCDRNLDLGWAGDGFRVPDRIPSPLRGFFPVEQKWLDYTGRAVLRGRDTLAGLCAKLMDIDASEYLFEESAYQRRRIRRVSFVVAALALLTVAAVVGALLAVSNQREAERNAIQAQAQAEAAEALLAASDSPTLAIDRALKAATHSDSPTIRSAMLAVSQASRRLKRAIVYTQTETGHPEEGARFSADGKKLLVWGADKAPDTSRVRAWDVTTGAMEVDVVVTAAGLRDVTRVDGDHLVACSAVGPVLVEVKAARTTRLSPAGAGRTCEIHRFANGLVLLSAAPGADGSAYVVSGQGKVITVDGMNSVAANLSARSVLLAGPAGVVVATGSKQTSVTSTPASARFADSQDRFAVRFGQQDWAIVTLQAGVPALRKVEVPSSAVDVAPVLDVHLTNDLAWITADGTIGWSRDSRQTKLRGSPAVPKVFDTTLEPLSYDGFLAVHGSEATIVSPPDGVGTAPANAREWTQVPTNQAMGLPSGDNTDPIAARCPSGSAVLLRSEMPSNQNIIVKGANQLVRLTSRGQFDDRCDVLDAGRSLTLHLSVGEPVTVRSNLVADAVALSPAGDQVAVVRSGFPIEILSTAHNDSLPRPWDVTVTPSQVATALDERVLIPQPKELVIAETSGVVGRIPLPGSVRVAAAKPDGTGGAVTELGVDRVLIADGQSAVPAAGGCAADKVKYVPEPGFERSVAAAEAQVPVAGAVDCRTGNEAATARPQDVVSYDIGQHTGRIVSRSDGQLKITTWSRGDPLSIDTVAGPPMPPGNGIASFDPLGQTAVTYVAGARSMDLYRRDGAGWRLSLHLAVGLSQIVAAQPADDGSLVIAVSADGGFEMFDAATGRLVASDPVPSTDLHGVKGFATHRTGDHLTMVFQMADTFSATATVKIPVGIPALRKQLCALYPAEACTQ